MMKIYGRVIVPLCPVWWSVYRNAENEKRADVADSVDWSNAIELFVHDAEPVVEVTRVWINGKLQKDTETT
jgi:hypothetical protein